MTGPDWPHAAHADIELFNSIYPDVQKLEALANKHGIRDIFQDNNGKLLQVVLLLNLKITPGRTGNDAVDPTGQEYELKTVNLNNRNPAFTTHHHLNQDILDKYRAVPWIFTTFRGIQIERIYLFAIGGLRHYFDIWQEKITAGMVSSPSYAINNPKIPLSYIAAHGTVIVDNAGRWAPTDVFTAPAATVAQAALRQATEQGEKG